MIEIGIVCTQTHMQTLTQNEPKILLTDVQHVAKSENLCLSDSHIKIMFLVWMEEKRKKY